MRVNVAGCSGAETWLLPTFSVCSKSGRAKSQLPGSLIRQGEVVSCW